jgi:hypothetical protein
METIHEVAVALKRLSGYAAAAKQPRIEARIEIKQKDAEALPPAGSIIVGGNLIRHDRVLWILTMTLRRAVLCYFEYINGLVRLALPDDMRSNGQSSRRRRVRYPLTQIPQLTQDQLPGQ